MARARDRREDHVAQLIADREDTHGPWGEQAAIAQALKDALRSGSRWADMTPAQREALEMDCVKKSRIVAGDPACLDHWRDSQGYMRLGEPK